MNNRDNIEKECKKLKIKGLDDSIDYSKNISIITTIDEII